MNAPTTSRAIPQWRNAYPAKFDSVCALCGGRLRHGDWSMKFLRDGQTIYGHSACPVTPEFVSPKVDRNAPSADFSAIVAHFQTMPGKLQYPKIHFLAGNDELVLKFSRRTGKVGIVHATETTMGKFGVQARWFGSINPDGTLTRSGQMTLVIEDELNSWAADVEGMARAYGRLTGNCCYCARALTDARSTSVGYGPICAENYGLTWG